MRDLERRLKEVVDIVGREQCIDPEDVDLVCDAYRQVVALDPEDEQTPTRVSVLVRGMADVLDGAEEMQYRDEARQYLVAVEPELDWGAEDIGLNVNRLREFADFIEELPAGQFDMGLWGEGTAMDAAAHFSKFGEVPECGTPACIAGWAAVLYAGDAIVDTVATLGAAYGLPDAAAAALGLTGTTTRPPAGPRTLADELFVPDVNLSTVTQHDAARVLRRLADSACVDWSVIDDYDEKVEAEG